MIEIVEQENKKMLLLCANCHSDNDVTIIRIQRDKFSKEDSYLCANCRAKLMQLLICDANK